MTPFEIERDNEAYRVIAVIAAGWAVDASGLRGAEAVAAVEDLLLIEPDRLAHTMGADVGEQFVELGTVEQGKEVREQVKLKIGEAGGGIGCGHGARLRLPFGSGRAHRGLARTL
jgi:hypothetical protein